MILTTCLGSGQDRVNILSSQKGGPGGYSIPPHITAVDVGKGLSSGERRLLPVQKTWQEEPSSIVYCP